MDGCRGGATKGGGGAVTPGIIGFEADGQKKNGVAGGCCLSSRPPVPEPPWSGVRVPA